MTAVPEDEPPTEPIRPYSDPPKPAAATPPVPPPPPAANPKPAPEIARRATLDLATNPSAPLPKSGPFSKTHFRFTTGLRAGEVATIRDESDHVLLTYRSFASVVGIVAALVSGIVLIAGLASVLFLFNEGSPVRALIALGLTIVFSFVITLLVPRTNVTLYDDGNPALTIAQLSLFPEAVYLIAAPNGAHLAELRKSFLSRIGRHRWTIVQEGRYAGEAREDSFGGALLRKLFGKFSRKFETNLRIEHAGADAGFIRRRPDSSGRTDVLELTSDAIDRRVAVALAALVLGREP